MNLEATSVKIHETTWSGKLKAEQLTEILVKALREELYTPHSGMSLTVVRVEPSPDGNLLPEIHYDLVHDHEWYMRPKAVEPQPVDDVETD